MMPYIIVVVCCAVFALMRTIHRAGAHKSVFPSAITGILALTAVNHAPFLGGAMLAMNLFNVSICAFFGIPGLIALLMLRMICVI